MLTSKEFFTNYKATSQAEFTSRLIPGDDNFDRPELSEYGTYKDKKCVVYYRPADPKNQEEWLDFVDWESVIDRAFLLDENEEEDEQIV